MWTRWERPGRLARTSDHTDLSIRSRRVTSGRRGQLETLTPAEINGRVLVALAVVLAVGRAAGWALSKLGQPRVQGEILAGILLGPSVLGLVWPEAFAYVFPTEIVGALKVLAQIGLVLFMFLVGQSLDLDKLRGHGRKAIVISHASIITPVVLGGLLGIWLHPRLGGGVDRLGFVLFMGAAMAITAFPVLARILQETGLADTEVGTLTITCAAVDDATAWCLLAVVVATVESSDFGGAGRSIGLALVFLATMLWIVKPLLGRVPSVPVWLAICLALLGAWTTEQIGIHAIFGAFMAGIAMPRHAESRSLVHEQLEHVAVTFLLPVFFVVVGLATRVDTLDTGYLWGVTALVIFTAIVGKLGGSTIAARAMGESWRDAAAIGVLMNTRGLTELVILSVGLELGVITPTVFTIMVLMAITTTFMATPLLAVILPVALREKEPETGSPTTTTADPGPDGDLARVDPKRE